MSGFAVLVRAVDDSFDVYGPIRDENRAQSYADWFNAQVEKRERENPDEPAGVAWAYVMPLSKPRSAVMLASSGLA